MCIYSCQLYVNVPKTKADSLFFYVKHFDFQLRYTSQLVQNTGIFEMIYIIWQVLKSDFNAV